MKESTLQSTLPGSYTEKSTTFSAQFPSTTVTTHLYKQSAKS